MRQLRDDTHLILDGEVRVYRRERSRRWQAAFSIDGHTVRVSTGKRDLADAKEYARDTCTAPPRNQCDRVPSYERRQNND